MKKAFSQRQLAWWLGPDTKSLWATSFTMDEHQAFAFAYHVFGGHIPRDDVHMRFQRSGFRRAGQGAMPRAWLRPVHVPAEHPLPTYHPKLALADTREGYRLVISTGNLTHDDLRNTRNLAVGMDVSDGVAQFVRNWIEFPPTDHRALCLVVRDGMVSVKKPNSNLSSFDQFMRMRDRCPSCTRTRARSGLWVVAAPFWSPGALARIFEQDRDGSVEAYFRTESLWRQIALGAQSASSAVALNRVTAYELRDRGDLPRWHHKVVGWRCCSRSSARAALYLGSANATICGFFGRTSNAVNWEAGIIWLGSRELWDHARAVARAGYAASPRLATPNEDVDPTIKLEDDLGPVETDEIERLLAAHLGRCIRINRRTRQVRRVRTDLDTVRALGRIWRLTETRLRVEEHAEVRDLGPLKPGNSYDVKREKRAQVFARYQCQPTAGQTLGSVNRAETTIDLVELDPEPKHPKPTRQTAIASALAGLWAESRGENPGDGPDHNGFTSFRVRDDVRFPFADFFAMQKRRPTSADEWLKRILSDVEALKPLPEHWRQIARELRET